MNILDEIKAELSRATMKYPQWPTDPLHALAVLGEEYGELNKAMLQMCYEPHKTSREEVRSEAIQTAAMALRLAMSLDEYEYEPCVQHTQEPLQNPQAVPTMASMAAQPLAALQNTISANAKLLQKMFSGIPTRNKPTSEPPPAIRELS